MTIIVHQEALGDYSKDVSCVQPPIVENFYRYFSRFNTKKILVVTDEDLSSDLRVQNQIAALRLLSDEITVLKVQPKNNYSEQQKNHFKIKIAINVLKNFWKLPVFFLFFKKWAPDVALRQKSKQGIYNDNSHFLVKKIDTDAYSLVVCNNLISASIIDIQPKADYIYDVHELEVFRHRKYQSLERSFYVYLQEKKVIKNIKNLITIGKENAKLIAQIYRINECEIECIYNQNFVKDEPLLNYNIQTGILLIYVGRVDEDRGLDDIIDSTKDFKVLVIACNYSEAAINYLLQNANAENLILFRGMNYQKFLSWQLKKYAQAYFLLLISPTSLSYRNALPNKFFQAQALGLPIISYPKTYLSKIINTYQCGLIFDKEIKVNLRKVNINQYRDMCNAMECEVGQAIKQQQL